MLGERIAQHGAKVWLVNTGWTGGPYGTGSRMKLAHTRAMVRAALAGALDGATFTKDPVFGFEVPAAVPDVPAERARAARAPGRTPRPTTRRRASSPRMFRENFEQFRPQVSEAVAAAGPWPEAQGRSSARLPEHAPRCARVTPRSPHGRSKSSRSSAIPSGTTSASTVPRCWRWTRAAVQRLRYVRQVGHAFLVYPGATHTRFEHALGAYHLTRRALASLEERGELDHVPEDDCLAVRLAALLHDIGHYPFSHALEEAGFPVPRAARRRQAVPGRAGRASAARSAAPASRTQFGALITGTSPSALQGLISGSLDLDKIDYLSRDARMCGVPYGTVDVDRLLATLTLVETAPGRYEVGVQEKGVSALESLLFAKYQMYRNVYWHHAVRSATCMFKRAVRGAVRARQPSPSRPSPRRPTTG